MWDEAHCRSLEERIAELEQENQIYREAIAGACETLGHEGDTPTDLRDAIGQLERLLDRKDLDVELEGLAKRLQTITATMRGAIQSS